MGAPVKAVRALVITLGGSVLASAFIVACDQVYADPVVQPFGSTFGTADASAGLTSPRTKPIACPRTARENGPCTVVGTTCEYGESADPSCNALFRCTPSEFGPSWEEARQGEDCPVCPGPDAGEIVEGTPCSVPKDGGEAPEDELQCATATAICACTTGRDGAHAHSRKWVCKKFEDLCPSKRPLLGQACSGDKVCDYGSCLFKRGSRMLCEDGVWQTEFASCN
jgi:hypothetical protein